MKEILSNSFNININKEEVTIPPSHVIKEIISNSFNININKEEIKVNNPPKISNVIVLNTDASGNFEIQFDIFDADNDKLDIFLKIGSKDYKTILVNQKSGTIAYRGIDMPTGKNVCSLKVSDGITYSFSEEFTVIIPQVIKDDIFESIELITDSNVKGGEYCRVAIKLKTRDDIMTSRINPILTLPKNSKIKNVQWEKGIVLTDYRPSVVEINSKTNSLMVDLDGIKGNVTKIENNYVTQSELNLTSENLEVKFSESGGSNLVKNGAFKNGTSYWTKWGSPSSYEVGNSANGYGQELRIVTTGSDQGAYQTIEGLRIGIPHTVVADVWVASGTCLIYINIDGTWWSSSPSSGTGWKKLSITFTPTKSTVKLLIGRGREGANGDYRFTGIRMYEGEAIQAWTPHHSEVYNGSTVIDASGVTVNNGALRVKNNAGKTVLEGDSNGNLVLSGTLKSESSNGLYASLSSGGLTLRDSQKSEEVLRLNTSFFASNRDMNGVTFAMPQYSDFIRFSHIDKPSLESGWSSSNTQYNFMDFWSSNQTVGGASYKKGINVYSPMYVNNGIQFFSGTDNPSEVLGAVSWDNGKGTIWNMMGLYGDNGAILGYKNGSNLQARILVSEASHPGTGDNIKSWGNWNLSGYTIHQGTFSGSHVNSYSNPVTRTYTSTYCIESENKQVRINLENIQITDGKAIINIPNKYVGINNGYIVSSIVKKGKGDVWVAKETENRFTLEATDDIKVNVEIIIKLEESASYELKTADDTQLCIDMSTGQPIV